MRLKREIEYIFRTERSMLGCPKYRGHLTEAQMARRTGICNLLIGREKTHDFLNSFLTGNDKLICYNNLKIKRSWPTKYNPKSLHQKKVMLLIWWDWKGTLNYGPLPPDKKIDSDVYCKILDKFKKEIEKNNAQNRSTGWPSSSITTMFDLIILWTHKKNWGN